MSINELLKKSGVQFSHTDASRLGMIIMNKAKEKGIKWTKKEEMVRVNDFPEDFTQTMQDLAIQYFSSKNKK